MEAKARTLEETLNDSVDFYVIPQYQRPYTWSNDNFKILWDDLTDAYDSYITALKNNDKPEFYFLGPVVFVKTGRNYDIIDGQQRTTTFHILLWSLYHIITDETEKYRLLNILTFLGQGKDVKLKVSSLNSDAFNFIKNNEDIDAKSKMKDCALFFKDKVKDLIEPENFSQFLREYAQFVVITAEDYGKAWDLFIGLNGKGERLNPTDLVKAHVCSRSDVGNNIAEIWDNGILPLNKESTAYLLFLARFKAKRFISEKDLFKEFSVMFPKEISTSDIARHSNIFQCFWNTSIEKIPEKADCHKLSIQSEKSLRILRDLKRKDFTTLIFQYAESFGIKSIFEEDFLKLMASYQIRMAIAKERVMDRQFVGEDFKKIDFSSKSQTLLKIAEFLKKNSPDDISFERAVKEADYNNKPARIILQHNEEGDTGNRKISGFDLEHLMPQTGTNEWYSMAGVIDENGEPNKEYYSSLVNNIGNLFIIDKKTNIKVKNFDFSIKKSFYQEKLKHWSIGIKTADKTDWKPSDIEERALEIATWAKSYWRL